MGFKPQNALKCCEFAYKGEYITTAESNPHSNPVSAFISWAKMRDEGVVFYFGFLQYLLAKGYCLSAFLPWGLCFSFSLPPVVRALSAQPGAPRLRFMFCQHDSHPRALDKHSAASFQMSCSDLSFCLSRGKGVGGIAPAIFVNAIYCQKN